MYKGRYSSHHESQADNTVLATAVNNLADGKETEQVDGIAESEHQQERGEIPVGGQVLGEFGHLKLAS